MNPQAGQGPEPRRPVRGKPLTCAELVERLCEVSARLREARRVHLETYHTLIPHVFMGDVLARMGDCLILGITHAVATNGPEVSGIMDALERGMEEGDREARNVIGISFVRDAEVEIFFDDLVQLLGPKTRAQVAGA